MKSTAGSLEPTQNDAFSLKIEQKRTSCRDEFWL